MSERRGVELRVRTPSPRSPFTLEEQNAARDLLLGGDQDGPPSADLNRVSMLYPHSTSAPLYPQSASAAGVRLGTPNSSGSGRLSSGSKYSPNRFTRRPVSGEWTSAQDGIGLLGKEYAGRSLEGRSSEALYQKWQKRMSFDQWHRRFAQANKAIFERLYRTSTFQKGKSAQLQRAVLRWVEYADARRQRTIKKLQAVADMRLTMLMSDLATSPGKAGGADPLRKTRQLTVRWSHPLAYKTFHAWKGWLQTWKLDPSRPAGEENLLRATNHWKRILLFRAAAVLVHALAVRSFKRRSRRAYVRMFAKRAWRRWILLWGAERQAGKQATGAAKKWRRIGLGKAYRQWVAMTDTKAEQNAQKAVRRLRSMSLSKGFQKWYAETDTFAEQKARKAVLFLRHLGLSKCWRHWYARTEIALQRKRAEVAVRRLLKQNLSRGFQHWLSVLASQAEVKAEKAVRYLRQIGLTKALRQWVAVTDTKVEVNAQKAVKRLKQMGLARGLAKWVAETDTKAEQKAQKAVRFMRNLGLSKCWKSWLAICAEAAALRTAERAARSIRQMGLAKGLRQWIAMTAKGAVKKAQQAMRYLRNQNLARGLSHWKAVVEVANQRKAAEVAVRRLLKQNLSKGFQHWLSNLDTKQEQNAQRAIKYLRQRGLAKCWNQWLALCNEAAAIRAANRAARSLRQMGLAKGLRQWIAMTAKGAVKKAQQAMRWLRNQALARGFAKWVTETDTKAEQKAQKAVRFMRQLGLGKSWNQWKALLEEAARIRAAERAARSLRQMGLAKGLRQWIAMTAVGAVKKAQQAMRWLRNQGLTRAWSQWAAETEIGRQVRKAENVIKGMFKPALAKALRQWIAMTAKGAVKKAQQAMLWLRNQNLARGMAQWVAMTDTKAEQKAQKAVRFMRNLGLSKGFRQWEEISSQTRRAALAALKLIAVNIGRALRKWHEVFPPRSKKERDAVRSIRTLKNQGLSRGFKQWVEATDLSSRELAKMRKAVGIMINKRLYLAIREWAAACAQLRAASLIFTGSVAKYKKASQQLAFEALAQNANKSSRANQVMTRSLNAFRKQALFAAFQFLADLRDGTAKWKEHVGRIFHAFIHKELRNGWDKLLSNRVHMRLAHNNLVRVSGFTRDGAYRRGFDALAGRSFDEKESKKKMRAAAQAMRHGMLFKLFDTWRGFASTQNAAANVFTTGVLQSNGTKLTMGFKKWRRRATEIRLNAQAVVTFIRSAKAVGFVRWRTMMLEQKQLQHATKRVIAYWRGQHHALAFYDWRHLCDKKAQALLRTKAAIKRARYQNFGHFFTTWAAGVRARLANAAFLSRAIAKWELREAAWALNILRIHAAEAPWKKELARARALGYETVEEMYAAFARQAEAERMRVLAVEMAAEEAQRLIEEREARRKQEEAEQVSLLQELIKGCAEEIAERHRLLDKWGHHPRIHGRASPLTMPSPPAAASAVVAAAENGDPQQAAASAGAAEGVTSPTRREMERLLQHANTLSDAFASSASSLMTTLQAGQLVDTVGDARPDALLVDTVGDGRPDTIVDLNPILQTDRPLPERLRAPDSLFASAPPPARAAVPRTTFAAAQTPADGGAASPERHNLVAVSPDEPGTVNTQVGAPPPATPVDLLPMKREMSASAETEIFAELQSLKAWVQEHREMSALREMRRAVEMVAPSAGMGVSEQ